MHFLVITLVAANASAAPGAYSADQCTSCHSGSVGQIEASVHGAKRAGTAIACTACHASHGKRDPAAANAPLRRSADLATCGGCHADELAVYRETYHGKYQALGKTNVPTCAFCHAGHELPRSEERSPLFATNVARMCASCHADGERDEAAMVAALDTPETGRFLYRKNAGAWAIEIVLGALTFTIVLVLLLLLMQWVRVKRGEPGPEHEATPGWFYGQLAVFVVVFLAVEQSGVALLYAAPGGGLVHSAMNSVGQLVMGVFGSADARSVAHRLGGVALLVVMVVHVLSVLLSHRIRSRLRMPGPVISLLVAEVRRGIAPADAPGLDLWPLFYRLVLGSVAIMILTGIAQWNAFWLMSTSGFGVVRYTDLVHEWVGRALAIGVYGGVLGVGLGLGVVGRMWGRGRAAGMATKPAATALVLLLAAIPACSSGAPSPAPGGKIDLTDLPRHGSSVAPVLPGTSPRVFPSAETCRTCHPREYAEWKRSYHSGSVSLPTFRAMYTIFDFGTQGKNPEYCFYCHAPESKLMDKGHVATLSKAVLAGEPIPSEGVTCAACHMISDLDPGAYLWTAAARYDVRAAPAYHARFKTSLTTSSALCTGCHDYDNLNLPKPDHARTPCCTVYRGWEQTAAAKQGVTCQSCHMGDYMDVGPKGRPSGIYGLVGLSRYLDDRGAVSHVMPGSRSEAMLKKAVVLQVVRARVSDGRLRAEVQIQNRAAHNIPDG